MPRPASHKSALPSAAALRTSGLPEREAAVWYALTADGPANVTDLARRTGLHRPAVYAQLGALSKKGLVEAAKGPGRRRYQSTGVARLAAWTAEQGGQLADPLVRLKKAEAHALPEEIRIYRGKELRRVWEELAKSPKRTVFYRYDGYPGDIHVSKYVPDEYIESLKSHGLERFVITNQALRRRAFVKRVECASRMLPGSFDAFEDGITQFVYGDTMALVDLKKEIAFVIKNEALASFHRKLFRYLYRSLAE